MNPQNNSFSVPDTMSPIVSTSKMARNHYGMIKNEYARIKTEMENQAVRLQGMNQENEMRQKEQSMQNDQKQKNTLDYQAKMRELDIKQKALTM